MVKVPALSERTPSLANEQSGWVHSFISLNYVGVQMPSGFLSYLPSGCPPKNAIVGPKLLFRLVRKSRFDDADFQTTYEEGKFLRADPCQRCSISTLATEAAARHIRKVVPNLARRGIAAGVVPADAGVIQHTPSSHSNQHWSWWPAADIVRHNFFELTDAAA